jgi:DNA polymerase, archaea type
MIQKFILDKRCQYHNIQSPVGYSQSGSSTFLYGKKHLDLHKIYSKEIFQKGVFNDKYRTLHLEEVSQALLGIGKYSDSKNNAISGEKSHLLSTEEQISYVARDSELTMMLACYKDCLALRIMEFIAMYSQMDYVMACHTGVTKWYTSIYDSMIERTRHKIPKQDYGGGNSMEPKKGFYKNEPVDELDVKGMYPTIAIKYNISFETVNCRCCKDNLGARIPAEIMNEINIRLQESCLIERKIIGFAN